MLAPQPGQGKLRWVLGRGKAAVEEVAGVLINSECAQVRVAVHEGRQARAGLHRIAALGGSAKA